MKYSGSWHDFKIIATGGGEKLERWGGVYLLRPDPQAIWAPAFDFSKYKDLNAKYTRSSDGGGHWTTVKKFPDEWTVAYTPVKSEKVKSEELRFYISPTNFKHTGLFPEQAVNWDKVFAVIASRAKQSHGENERAIPTQVLNLFAYTGGATVACAKAGAHVTHVDASRGMTDVCKRNCKLNDIPDNRVRFIVDDCVKFVEREIRRGKKYDAIIMDPPSFGRGANGEVWKIETSLDYLVGKCCELLSDKPLFFLINSYTTGLQPTVIKNVLQRNLAKLKINANIDAYEIGLPTSESIILPAGCSCFATFSDI